MNGHKLRSLITRSLKKQGFTIRAGQVSLPATIDKPKLRNLHSLAVQHRIERCRSGLVRIEQKLLNRLASGDEIDPEKVAPRLVLVESESENECLFRYASLHWSIPVSSGYGRRLRFLVFDDHNDKLIGLFGLADPVFTLTARDQWIGWDKERRNSSLRHVMDAFVLGAVPPYSYLLCGKLVAMLVASTEVKNAFKQKYGGSSSIIRRRPFDGRLALITTTSALGRSSIYNRLKYNNHLVFQSVGFTVGSGEFHFSNGLYGAISNYAARYCKPTAKQLRWGKGFRNRREVIKKCLGKIRLSPSWMYHQIQREIFVVPLAGNTREFLRGEQSKLRWFNQTADDLSSYFKERWMLPRSQTDRRYKLWNSSDWRLWAAKEAEDGRSDPAK